MNTDKVIYGALAGFATGLLLAVLFAPDKGSNTRESIARKGREYSGNLKSKLSNARGKTANALKQVKNEAKDLAEKGKSAAQTAKKELKQNLTSSQSYQA